MENVTHFHQENGRECPVHQDFCKLVKWVNKNDNYDI